MTLCMAALLCVKVLLSDPASSPLGELHMQRSCAETRKIKKKVFLRHPLLHFGRQMPSTGSGNEWWASSLTAA